MYALAPLDDAKSLTAWDSETVWEPGVIWPVVAALAAVVALVFAVRAGRARRAFAKALEERGWLLERERESAAQGAVGAERARIARELHDIVSHNVSLMVVQAGAARRVLDAEPGQAAEALLAVEAAGRDTMTELRHLLGVLAPPADGGEPGELSPQPSLSRLSPLVDRIAFAGLPVEVRISGEPRPLPSGVDLTAYRIIQEALTNALKHGDGSKAEVLVRYTDHYLRVEVLNSGPSVLSGDRPAPAEPQDGRGLLGLRQRVRVFGGDLDARRRLGGGFRVRARIPLEHP
ncbi:histidine kinase [Amycolatopsis sp. NBC_00345]|uniref:sensor histidine kinase n=1 Tax=Amycolatopsis sp. NBC_00345 TaxID=2975955 RepID=UPI002E275339